MKYFILIVVKWRACEHYRRSREGGGRRVTHDKSASKPTTRQDIRPPLQPQPGPQTKSNMTILCVITITNHHHHHCDVITRDLTRPSGGKVWRRVKSKLSWRESPVPLDQSSSCRLLRSSTLLMMGREYQPRQRSRWRGVLLLNRKTSK